MASLQRSSVSFRRQGSSGRIWDAQMTNAWEDDVTKKQAKGEIEDIVATTGQAGKAKRRSSEHAALRKNDCSCSSVFRLCMRPPSTAS